MRVAGHQVHGGGQTTLEGGKERRVALGVVQRAAGHGVAAGAARRHEHHGVAPGVGQSPADLLGDPGELGGIQARHYDKHDYHDEKTEALEAWDRKLKAIASGAPAGANAVPLKQPRESVA